MLIKRSDETGVRNIMLIKISDETGVRNVMLIKRSDEGIELVSFQCGDRLKTSDSDI